MNYIKPLYSDEAEKAVLASILAQPEACMDDALDLIKSDDFFVPRNKDIFEALKDLWNRRLAIDIMTVHQWLEDRKLAEMVGSPGCLAELGASLVSHLKIKTHIKIVRDKAILRKTQEACLKIIEEAEELPEDIEGFLGRSEYLISSVGGGSFNLVEETGEEFVTQTLKDIMERRDGKRPKPGIPFGFPGTDKLVIAEKGDLVILGGRPGAGKSGFGFQSGFQMREAGYNVGAFSMEMKNSQLRMRILSSQTGIPFTQLRMGELDKFDAEKVEAVANKLALMKLPLIETPNLAVEKIRAQARRWKKKGLDVLIIDYLQIMDESGISKGDRNRMQEVSHMTKTLKNMAKDLDILVIALAQVNRQSEEKRTPPGLHNLRESGSIEQDADIVLFVHPEEEPQEGAVSVPYKLICAKQRNGPLFKKDFKYLPRIVTFKEV